MELSVPLDARDFLTENLLPYQEREYHKVTSSMSELVSWLDFPIISYSVYMLLEKYVA
jgi:hypothetical protein